MHIEHLTPQTAKTVTSKWQAELPTRMRAVFSTIAADETAVHLGIFSDAELLSVITLQPRGRGLYETHLALKKGQAVVELLPALFSIREQLFQQLAVRELSGWIPRVNKGIQAVTQAVGFRETGATLLQMVGTRLTEWQQVVLRIN